MYDLIIIGGGPAGLTATVYAIRKRLNCLLISPDLGGKANARMHIEGVDTFNVINGGDLVRRFHNEVEYLDFARILEKAAALRRDENRFIVTTGSGKELEARADHPGHRCGRRTAERARRRSLLPARGGLFHRQLCTAVYRQAGGAGGGRRDRVARRR